MAKSIKLKNDFYWDSKSIMHNKKLLSELLEDTNWQDAEILHGEAHSSSFYKCQYRKIGNRVDLCGCIRNVTAETTLLQLPAGFRNSNKRLTFSTSNDKLSSNVIRIYETGKLNLILTTGDLTTGVDVFLNGISFYID